VQLSKTRNNASLVRMLYVLECRCTKCERRVIIFSVNSWNIKEVVEHHSVSLSKYFWQKMKIEVSLLRGTYMHEVWNLVGKLKTRNDKTGLIICTLYTKSLLTLVSSLFLSHLGSPSSWADCPGFSCWLFSNEVSNFCFIFRWEYLTKSEE